MFILFKSQQKNNAFYFFAKIMETP
ncbi:uncharacterized protein METZ01_LOCUS320891 [marine metagenome]|uniref:Uncharacterized protein n=1 Tax=marine metagenome TaxID=408172 RepID=A0A382P5C7_9ZZZZ